MVKRDTTKLLADFTAGLAIVRKRTGLSMGLPKVGNYVETIAFINEFAFSGKVPKRFVTMDE
jgi:urease gamma subunit